MGRKAAHQQLFPDRNLHAWCSAFLGLGVNWMFFAPQARFAYSVLAPGAATSALVLPVDAFRACIADAVRRLVAPPDLSGPEGARCAACGQRACCDGAPLIFCFKPLVGFTPLANCKMTTGKQNIQLWPVEWWSSLFLFLNTLEWQGLFLAACSEIARGQTDFLSPSAKEICGKVTALDTNTSSRHTGVSASSL